MYNGIGLQTTRGSGTNGYVQKNCAVVRKHKRQPNENQPVRGDFANKVPNGDILLHAKKRDIEVKILEHREALEEQGLKEEEIEQEVARYRATLQLCYENEQRKLKSDNFSFNNLKQETHHLAEANQLKNSKLREAFGISEYFQDGTSFDPERREREAQLKKEVEKKSYQWLKTPSPENDENAAADSDIVWRKESDNKQNENDQIENKDKKDKKEKKKALQKKKDKREDKKGNKKLKKKSKHIDTSSSSSDSDDDSESSSDKYEIKKRDSKRKRKHSSKTAKNKRRKISVDSDSSDSSYSEIKSSKKKVLLSKTHKYHKDNSVSKKNKKPRSSSISSDSSESEDESFQLKKKAHSKYTQNKRYSDDDRKKSKKEKKDKDKDKKDKKDRKEKKSVRENKEKKEKKDYSDSYKSKNKVSTSKLVDSAEKSEKHSKNEQKMNDKETNIMLSESFDIEPLHSSRKEESDVCNREKRRIDDQDSKKDKTNYDSEDSLPEEIVKEIKKYKLKYAGHVKDNWIIKENNVAKRI